ncbi:MAG: hypothetical protein IT357_14000 [Gemmatimonadaceae bacterium]|nr:hypothetical protein [Gemmatimonadaceae bacterium]
MSDRVPDSRPPLGLRAGDWVIVRSKEEILSTLDENACLERLPFQPEMLAFCGRRMQVAKVAHKTCDNIKKTGGRRMHAAVHLEGGRCDGAQHGGCQADCVFFWKEAWLRRADSAESAAPAWPAAAAAGVISEELVQIRARARGSETSDDPTWVCQTTALYDATELLPWWDLRQYVRDVTSGNHSAWHMTKILIAATYRKFVAFGPGYSVKIKAYNAFQSLVGGKPFPEVKAQVKPGDKTPTEILNLQVGELVEVRSGDEIDATITPDGKNRGMRYDMEMRKYSGHRYRVQMRVDKLIDEKTGKMVPMKNPCIQLENVYCRAECTDRRLGCPRASNTYWREIWLRRVESP